MREFDKWWDSQDEKRYNPGQWWAYEKVWKAALEWALSKQTDVAYSIPVVLVDDIQKELED